MTEAPAIAGTDRTSRGVTEPGQPQTSAVSALTEVVEYKPCSIPTAGDAA